MARSDKRYMVYPAPRAIEILGAKSPFLNQALECWAAELAWATAGNSKTFLRSFMTNDNLHNLHDWAVLAHSIRDKPFDPEFSRPGELLAAAVEDAQRFENIGYRWMHTPDPAYDPPRKGDPADLEIAELAEKLRKLDYSHAWAIIVVVHWFWEHHTKIKVDEDEWWTLGFRRQWTAKEESAGKSEAHAPNGKQASKQKSKAEKKK
jgi:hypothetical protein